MMHIPQIGDSLPEYFMEVTPESVYRYAEASGDYNPLHINEEFASSSQYGRTIAHGMLILGHLSDMLTTAFNENWINNGRLKIRFRSPVFIPNKVQTYGTVTKVAKNTGSILITCAVGCRDENNAEVLKGDAYITFG